MYSKINFKENCGCRFIQELIRTQQKDLQSKFQRPSDTGRSSNTLSSQQIQQKDGEKVRVVVYRKRERNFFNKIYQLSPSLQDRHIFKLFGYKGINQKAFQNPDFEQSVFYSHFESRIVQKVQIYEHALVIEMTEPTIPMNQPSVEYIIEKYKSKGDAKFYELAVLIEDISKIFKFSEFKAHPEEKPQSVKKWLDYLGNDMFVCTLGSKKVAISKALLTYLEYDLNQFAIQAIKYRAIIHELFSSMNYAYLIKHLLNCLKHIAQLNTHKLSTEQFKQLTTIHFNDFAYSKSKAKSFCSMSVFMLNPTFLCHKINQIYYKTDELSLKASNSSQMMLAIKEEKERVQFAEYNTINKISKCPKNFLQQNQKKIASFSIIQRKQNRQ